MTMGEVRRRSTLTVVLCSESQPLMGFSLIPYSSSWKRPRCAGSRASATWPSPVWFDRPENGALGLTQVIVKDGDDSLRNKRAREEVAGVYYEFILGVRGICTVSLEPVLRGQLELRTAFPLVSAVLLSRGAPMASPVLSSTWPRRFFSPSALRSSPRARTCAQSSTSSISLSPSAPNLWPSPK
ncbi:hypothetical protein AZE42_10604 [Rhizopogon vesiculosus]|uniref:Uncharacterized protein n=1 Tax=Rhizopogon vesiculosus TaxID=180088 RepID=A0A1J8PPM0_9AGAM|nr:hypothetical protein AZE42_10604 [Rhizopogon vesiculosus]